MTQNLAQPLPPAEGTMSLEEQYNYYCNLLEHAGEHARVVKLKKQIADLCAEEFETAWKAHEKALGLERAPPLERLIWYRSKPMTQEDALAPHQGLIEANAMAEQQAMVDGKEPVLQPIPEVYSWEEQLLKLPREWQEDHDDWQKLRLRALNGDFGPAQQAEEIAWSQAAMMGVQE